MMDGDVQFFFQKILRGNRPNCSRVYTLTQFHKIIKISLKLYTSKGFIYQEATLTPGICPALALSLKAVLFNLKSRINDLEFPVATHLSLI